MLRRHQDGMPSINGVSVLPVNCILCGEEQSNSALVSPLLGKCFLYLQLVFFIWCFPTALKVSVGLISVSN